MDLFENEQLVYDNALRHIDDVGKGAPYDFGLFSALAGEYGKLLKYLRRATRYSDKTTVNLSEENRDLSDKVNLDALTGIYNRRYLEDNLKRYIKKLSRSGGLLSIMMLDVDFFKKYNDTYGHGTGDTCLKTIAETLSGCVEREDDFVARYGGEEFVYVLPYTDEHGAYVMASRALEKIAERNIPHEKSEVASYVTVSIGITTTSPKHTHNGEDYIKCADEALYMSKQSGRNRYTFLKFREDTA